MKKAHTNQHKMRHNKIKVATTFLAYRFELKVPTMSTFRTEVPTLPGAYRFELKVTMWCDQGG
eukprot:3914119-Amphidinium_carterae.1